MPAFTKSRAMHQQATPAEVAGDLPVAMHLAASEADEAQGWYARSFGWSGCLDAPNLLPIGGVKAVFIDPAVGGMGFEGMAARNRAREAY